MSLLYLYFVLTIMVAMIAALRGRVWWRWLLISLFITPMLAGLVVMVLPPEPQPYSDPSEYEAISSPQIEARPLDCILRIIRLSGYRDRNRRYDIFVNGVSIGVVPRDSVVDFQVPSGQIIVEVRTGRSGSRPLLIDAVPGHRIEIEVTRRAGPSSGIWADLVGSTYLVLTERPPVPVQQATSENASVSAEVA
jgi:hypothetical protein